MRPADGQAAHLVGPRDHARRSALGVHHPQGTIRIGERNPAPVRRPVTRRAWLLGEQPRRTPRGVGGARRDVEPVLARTVPPVEDEALAVGRPLRLLVLEGVGGDLHLVLAGDAHDEHVADTVAHRVVRHLAAVRGPHRPELVCRIGGDGHRRGRRAGLEPDVLASPAIGIEQQQSAHREDVQVFDHLVAFGDGAAVADRHDGFAGAGNGYRPHVRDVVELDVHQLVFPREARHAVQVQPGCEAHGGAGRLPAAREPEGEEIVRGSAATHERQRALVEPDRARGQVAAVGERNRLAAGGGHDAQRGRRDVPQQGLAVGELGVPADIGDPPAIG